MPSLGKASAELLVDVGIVNPAMLRDVGAVEAWRRLRFAHGKRVTITWIYALEIAIRGISWDGLSARVADRLRSQAEAIIAELEGSAGPTKRSRKPSQRA
jgi:DNA transformation protein